ncbi:MAG: lysophospholipid acyltransferase family protein [Lentisphaeria bacterium]|nr:lysophospholipid acyltransferase family protein [Lentisphaeria bacterium]
MSRDPVQKPAANLSDTRKNRLGSAILRGILSVFGPAAACFLVKFIALVYALTDKQAEQRALPYLKHRFPGDSGFRMKRHVWRLFTAQGEALIMALALANGQAKVRERNPEVFAPIRNAPGGLVFLCSHFGAWQAAMHCVNAGGREVAFVAKPDRNADVDKSRAFSGGEAAPMHIIDTAGAFGGLLEAFEVLDAGGAVGLMGDRCLEADSVPVQFFGGTARFPVAAFFLAAKAHAPVVPFFLTRGTTYRELQIEFGTVVRPQRPVRGASGAKYQEDVQAYAADLERMATEHPYDCFLFENVWEDRA